MAACGLAEIAVAVAFQHRMRCLATAAGLPVVAGQFALLILILPLWACQFLVLSASGLQPGSSLTVIFTLPNPICGSAAIPVILAQTTRQRGGVGLPLVGIGIPVRALTLMAIVLWRRLKTAGGSGSLPVR